MSAGISTLRCIASLASLLHPARRGRRLRPQHDDAARCIERFLDHVVVGAAGRDLAVPPDRPAALLERARHDARAIAIGARVADEDVAHRIRFPVGLASTREAGGRELTRTTRRRSGLRPWVRRACRRAVRSRSRTPIARTIPAGSRPSGRPADDATGRRSRRGCRPAASLPVVRGYAGRLVGGLLRISHGACLLSVAIADRASIDPTSRSSLNGAVASRGERP